MRDLQGMIVAITGASAGIGAALARELHLRGARLALSARRLELVEALVGELGGEHLALRCDVARPEDCAAFVAATRARFGRIDTLVCNAGYGLLRPVAQTSLADWQAIFATNLFGTSECIRAALPSMQAQEPRDRWRGQIVVVSSIVARRAIPAFGAYSATKAAQLSLCEALRVELRASAIAVTSVHPIGTRTGFGQAAAEVSGRALRSDDPTARFQQSAEHVARRIAAAVARPRAEVWPSRPSRWLAALATLIPGIADRAIARVPRMDEEARESGSPDVRKSGSL